MKLMDLMEPEETIGNLWHDMAHGMGGDTCFLDAAVPLSQVRQSLTMLFRAPRRSRRYRPPQPLSSARCR